MATKLKAEIRILIRTILESGIPGVGGGVDQTIDVFKLILDGVGVDQADRVWYKDDSLGISASTSFDLAGTLLDVYGNSFSFAKVSGIFLLNRSTGSVLALGPHATNGFGGGGAIWAGTSPRSIVRPESVFGWYDPAGVAVSAGSADVLALENQTAAACAYRVLILGKSS